MTVELLERYVKSEVENLHLRIDVLSGIVERIDQRLSRVERQLTLLINAVEDIKVRLAILEENTVTKEYLKQELKQFITKKEAENFATKQDVTELKDLILQFMKQFAPAGS